MPRIDLDRILSPHPYAKKILRVLNEEGFRPVVVGGAVRDALREKFDRCYTFEPAEADIDIASSASPEQVRERFPNFDFVEVGESFGVLILVAPDGRQYEVAQFRTESDYDGRKPGNVEPADSLEEDVGRRDFTVNGLALGEKGEVIDLVGGVEDLKNKVVRAIGDPKKRFKEDYLRPLRAVRISCVLGGEIEARTEKAIKSVAGEITSISWERIREELFQILRSSNSEFGMRQCNNLSLLEGILPELVDNKGVPQPEEYHPEGDVLEHSFQALGVADDLRFPPLVKLAVLLHDVGKSEALRGNDGDHMGGHALIGKKKAEKIATRLRLSNDEKQKLVWLVENHMRGSVLPDMRRAKQVKLIRTNQDRDCSLDDVCGRFDYFTSLLGTIIADSEASSHEVGGWLPVLEEFTGLLPHLLHLEELGTARELIDGNDLKDLGMEEGPGLGEILRGLHEKIFAGELDTRSSALKEAKKMIDEAS
ncbi:CCA tRNA nucleotidyltransferase [Candidatus Bipolaricaulota bacterium]|nr:CCA tRNA nucleotidyltransferase [Candidatus Bipolaricaulota bacterium]